ncbi:acyl-CoA thioesterase [Pseudomonas sp. UBA2684]|uniref:acyl-CoA thioesterase n=1 Tax=Pseudomonas sp. UBA2684 TaxID=1947311 RepID=UPI000E803318|nr:thioesterase family protein [Pseudomonas sp. UBA2684]HBX56178.1 MFS transporter [Pseudomonas sp.]|tara:strand:- start:9788 stop:10234 length:447 start_codon:yes stop_codon:yes gene_type:complete
MTTRLSRDAFTFFHPLRVRWAEVDPQNIVFNGHYLTYADVAITEYFRALGVVYPGDLSREGGDFFAIKSVLEYLAPAHFDDQLQIGVRVARLGRSSLSFNLGIWRADEALTQGELIYVHADSASRRSRALPEWLREKVRGYERYAAQE